MATDRTRQRYALLDLLYEEGQPVNRIGLVQELGKKGRDLFELNYLGEYPKPLDPLIEELRGYGFIRFASHARVEITAEGVNRRSQLARDHLADDLGLVPEGASPG